MTAANNCSAWRAPAPKDATPATRYESKQRWYRKGPSVTAGEFLQCGCGVTLTGTSITTREYMNVQMRNSGFLQRRTAVGSMIKSFHLCLSLEVRDNLERLLKDGSTISYACHGGYECIGAFVAFRPAIHASGRLSNYGNDSRDAPFGAHGHFNFLCV